MYAPIDSTAPLLLTVEGLLTEAECREVRELAETRGFETASIAYRDGPRVNPDVRDNERVTFEDPALAELVFQRASAHLPQLHGEQPRRVSERLRVYRYAVGQRFAMHRDGSVVLEGEQTRLTLMVYLNEVDGGGETYFPALDVAIVPVTGRALLFQHTALHESRPVRAGSKYVLRSDVFYAAQRAGREAEEP